MTSAGLNPSGTPLMEVMGKSVSERKRKEKNENKWEEQSAIMQDVVLSKSLSAELTALWGKITFKYFSLWYI